MISYIMSKTNLKKYCLHALFKESISKSEINTKVLDKITEIIKRNEGNFLNYEQSEKRKLFYPIQREKSANYSAFVFELHNKEEDQPTVGLNLSRITRQIKESFSEKILRLLVLKTKN